MITIPKGNNILNYLQDNNIKTLSPCNGKGICGKCKVQILNNELVPSELELKLLSGYEIRDGIRLACMHTVTKDTNIINLFEELKMQITDNVNINFEMDSYIKIKDDYIIRNETKLIKGLKAYGIAIDIGTTTCAILLVDLINNLVIDKASFLNPQSQYGADVISRIEYCNSEKNIKKLQKLIVNDIEKHILKLFHVNNLDTNYLIEIVIGANTTMNHLFMGVDPSSLAVAPYEPKFIEKQVLSSNLIFNNFNEYTNITILPGFDSYVGGDIASGIYSNNMHLSNEYQLLIDLGTNGEIVLGNKDKLYSTSTAAGPAFEGVNIFCGIGAIEGALNTFESLSKYTTINNKECIGICGSGLIDLTAKLLERNIIDKSGYMKNSFDITNTIKLIPSDIREIQLAKSAIRAGIEVLIKQANIKTSDISKVYISGGFGKHVNLDNLYKLDIIPKSLKTKTHVIGNSSLSGAFKYLFSINNIEIDYITDITEVINLSLSLEFQEEFVKYIPF